jgi:prolyl oligopeptidase
LAGAALLLLACSGRGPATTSRVDGLNALYDAYWQDHLERNPTAATYLGDHRYDDRLEDLSESAALDEVDALRGFLDRADAVDPAGLGGRDRLDLLLFRRLLERRIEGATFRPWLMPVSQQGGPHIGFPQIVSYHPFRSEEDYDHYVARLRAFPAQVEQVIDCMRRGIEAGIVRSRPVVEKVPPQIEDLIVDGPEKSPLYEPLASFPEGVPEGERARIRGDVERAIMGAVIPAYRRLLDFVRNEYLPACRDDVGVWALPDGEARYAFAIRRYTTTEMTPEEIHRIGLRELDRIAKEMDSIRREVGFRGDLRAFMDHLRNDPRFYYSAPSDLMDGFRAILRTMDGKMPLLFGRIPRAAYDLKEIEPYRAAAAPAAYYYPPPEDGSRPGYFYVNTYRLDSRPRYTMEALAYHEAVPGHHLQIAIAQELDSLPDFRQHQGFTVFVEGWGLYAEGLPAEVGLYRDPYSRFGRLTFDAWRAGRLVVDTGIHAMRWDRDRAIAFLEERTALSEHDVVSEVDRYIAWPGQALAYKIGELRIRDLRRKAEAALGERFDVRRFHDALLRNGALPLDLLEEEIGRWIAEEGG